MSGTRKIDELKCSEDFRAFAKALYEAYTANSDNLNFRGEQCPTWDELPSAIRSHWCAVAWRADLDGRWQEGTEVGFVD